MNCGQECPADQMSLRGQRTSSPGGGGAVRERLRTGSAALASLAPHGAAHFPAPAGPVFGSPETLFVPTGAPPPSRATGAAGGKHLAEETVLTQDGCACSPRPLPLSSPLWVCGAPGAARRRVGGALRATLVLCYLLGAERTSATCSRDWRAGGARPTPFSPAARIPRPPPPRAGTSRGILAKPAPAPLSAPFGHLLTCPSRPLPARPPSPETRLHLPFRIQATCHFLPPLPEKIASQGPAQSLPLGRPL